MDDAPAPQIDVASGEVLEVVMPGGTYRTYVMAYRVSNSLTGQVRAEASGLSIHDWLQSATAEELAFVGIGVVERIALYAAGVR